MILPSPVDRCWFGKEPGKYMDYIYQGPVILVLLVSNKAGSHFPVSPVISALFMKTIHSYNTTQTSESLVLVGGNWWGRKYTLRWKWFYNGSHFYPATSSLKSGINLLGGLKQFHTYETWVLKVVFKLICWLMEHGGVRWPLLSPVLLFDSHTLLLLINIQWGNTASSIYLCLFYKVCLLSFFFPR